MIDESKTYVYDGVEVVHTGRTASRVIKNACVAGDKGKRSVLYEVKPLDPEFEWKRFCAESELYQID